MWNPWRQLRIAGAVCIIIAALMGGHLLLTVLGLMIQYIGVVGAIDRIERLMDIITEKKEEK